MTSPITTHDLLPSEVAFVAAMQQLGFGRFEHLQIRGGELVLNPGSVTVRDVKFGSLVTTGKPSVATSELRPQVAEFFAYVREVDSGEIREVEVRHGLPFSMEIELTGGKCVVSQGGRRG
jgi:hypothetical protein